MPIGVFDSGIGGLTVAREIMRQMPNERIVYFGDTARVPYGSKSRETVTRYSRQIVRFLLEQKVKAIAVACNTASAYALPEIEAECPVPVIGVIRPGARTAVSRTINGRIGVIGTKATILSGTYSAFIKEIMPGAEVFGQPCPLFVPLVEEGLWEDPVTDEIARRYLASLLDSRIDTLIMGCTHYPLIRKTIGRAAGENVTLINPAYETAMELRRMLGELSLLEEHRQELGSREPQYRFYVSDMAGQFRQFANSIIKYGILAAEKIDIYNYSAQPLSSEEAAAILSGERPPLRREQDAQPREEEPSPGKEQDAQPRTQEEESAPGREQDAQPGTVQEPFLQKEAQG